MSFTPPRTKVELVSLAANLPDESFFLEHSRAREIGYIERSFSRWMENIEVARARLSGMEKLSCLDIGVSPFTFLLKGFFGQVHALDLTDAFRTRCESAGIQLHSGGVTSLAELQRLEKVDCVFFLEVLEHLHMNPVEVLRGVRSVLRPGGLLILSTPNMMCFANRVLMLCNRKLHHFTYPPFSLSDQAHGFGHDRVYMPAEMADYFAASGFHRIETLYQLNFDDMAHENDSWWERLKAVVPYIMKRVFPSTCNGIIMAARNP